jgi:hypothetical protein
MKDRKGKFNIACSMVDEAPEAVADILQKLAFVPMRVEALPMQGVFEYAGLSPAFDEIEEGEVIPTYEISILWNDDGSVKTVVVDREGSDQC